MKKQIIQETAMDHFIKFGYEGVKLAHIANDAGIKKQSLSYYYKSKETLFLELLQDSVNEECTYIRHYFADQTSSLEQTLVQFLTDYKVRFTQHKSAAFLAILSFILPVQLREQTIETYKQFNICLESELEKLFSGLRTSLASSIADCVKAYMTLLDGLLIQLVYDTPERYDQALNAFWPIYWSGITAEKRKL